MTSTVITCFVSFVVSYGPTITDSLEPIQPYLYYLSLGWSLDINILTSLADLWVHTKNFKPGTVDLRVKY